MEALAEAGLTRTSFRWLAGHPDEDWPRPQPRPRVQAAAGDGEPPLDRVPRQPTSLPPCGGDTGEASRPSEHPDDDWFTPGVLVLEAHRRGRIVNQPPPAPPGAGARGGPSAIARIAIRSAAGRPRQSDGKRDGARDEAPRWRAASRAAALLDRLEVARKVDRQAALRWLEELLEEFPHGSSYQALGRLVSESPSFTDLQAAAGLKRAWKRDPALWLVRRGRSPEGRGSSVRVDRRYGPTALSWRTAARLQNGFEDALELMRSDWRDAWLRLVPFEPGYLGYAAYLEVQAEHRRDEALADGLSDLAGSGNLDEVADHHRWFESLELDLKELVAPDRRYRAPGGSWDLLASARRRSDAAGGGVW